MRRRVTWVLAVGLVVAGGAAAAPTKVTLSVVVSGNGTVTSKPAGIDCKPTCVLHAKRAETVTLTASPNEGAEFSRWSKPCGTSFTCTVKMTAARTVHAYFAAEPPPPPPPPTPLSGHYVGTYTDGTFFDLDVAGLQVYNLHFDFNGECDNGSTSYDTGYVARGPYLGSTNGAFTATSHTVFSNSTIDATITGTVTTTGAASGDVSVTLTFNDGVVCTSKGTWTAKIQT